MSKQFSLQYKVPPGNLFERQLCKYGEQKLQSIPSEWDTISPKHYLAIMGILRSDINLVDQLIQCTYILLNVPWDWRVKLYIHFFITIQQIELISEICHFIINPDKQLHVNHLPTIKIGKQTYYGPSDGMANLSFSQFMDADHHLNSSKSLDLPQLAKLASILYQPRGTAYQHQEANKQISQFETLSENHLHGIAHFFSSVKTKWVKLLPHLFPNPNEKASGASNWGEPLKAISSSPVEMAQNAQQPAFNVLYYLNEQIAEQKKQAQQAKK